MVSNVKTPRKRGDSRSKKRPLTAINRLVENDLIRRVSYDEYRAKVKNAYSGPKGALLTTCSMLTVPTCCRCCASFGARKAASVAAS